MALFTQQRCERRRKDEERGRNKLTEQTETTSSGTDWLRIARDCFESSTDYFDANTRKNVERNISLFQSKHPSGSKYNSVQFKHRSRLFRPKTRSVVRKNEAAAAAAFFANVDVISVEPENDADPAQLASAHVMNELLNYRLTKTIPWFVTVMGAIQEAQVVGAVISKQYWEYDEKPGKEYQEVMDDLGQVLGYQEIETAEVTKDKPCINLIPIENFRFDPGASWTDVIGSSPYLIHMVPMYVDDVLGMMEKANPKTGEPKWKKYTKQELQLAMVEYDTIRQKRNEQKQDPLSDNGEPLKEFAIVWVHENFVRLNGEEVVYWTLGSQKLLTDPIPLEEAYFHGERPFAMGVSVIEAHKAMPESLVGLGAELQKEANETVNQRRDNVSLVLNKRYVVKRNQQVDIDSLLRNVPGTVTMATDVDADVRELQFGDVTSSSYQEQDRLNVDFDDLTGNFSQGTVATNRNLNETVGGMKMLGGSASMMTEYLLRTFVETWAEKALNQLAKLEQKYETDETILALCGQKAELAQRYGIDQVTDELLNQSLTVQVNVGLGATDPQQKLGRFMYALKSYGEAMQMMPDAQPEEIRKEVFGLLGYKNGDRFFKQGDQPPPQFMQQMQQMQEAMQKMQQQLQMQAMQLQNKAGELQVAQFDAETKRIAATKAETPNNGPTDIDVADAETKRIQALSDAGHKAAQTDLLQAQTVKTLVDAQLAPSVAMAKQATNTEQR